MLKTKNSHTINVVFVLAVACAFAASVLMVLMLGVRVYADIESTSKAEFSERVCLSYLSTKVHRSDVSGNVRSDEFAGIPALYIDEEIDGTAYNTVIYAYDGWLRELFCEKGLDLTPDSGTPILEVDSVSFAQMNNDLLAVEYLDQSGKTGNVFIHLRTGGGSVI